ncbi:MAG: tetratricopeptide repeat protein, partial [Ktedonobacteraceae bacterium]
MGKVYTLLSGIEATLGQSTEALNHLNLALEIFEKSNIKNEITIVCCNLADMYLRRAEYVQARPMLTRSYKLADEMGQAPIMSVALGNLGVLATRLGNLAEAEDWYQQALNLITPMGELFYTSLYYSYVATALIEQGKLDEAQPLLVQALKISHSTRIAPCTGFALVVLGQLRFARAQAANLPLHDVSQQELHQAQLRFEKLLLRARATLRLALTYDGLEADVRLDGQLLLARIAFLLEETEQAHEMATRALDEARASELVWLQARAHGLLGLILHAQDGFTAAAASFEHALDIFESTGMRLEHARVLYAQAAILLDHKVSARRRQAVADVSQVRLVFQECQAGLDLHSAEQLLKVRVIPTIRTLPR